MLTGRKCRRLPRFHFELLRQQVVEGAAVPANDPAVPVDQSLDGHATDAITPADFSFLIQEGGKGEAVFSRKGCCLFLRFHDIDKQEDQALCVV